MRNAPAQVFIDPQLDCGDHSTSPGRAGTGVWASSAALAREGVCGVRDQRSGKRVRTIAKAVEVERDLERRTRLPFGQEAPLRISADPLRSPRDTLLPRAAFGRFPGKAHRQGIGDPTRNVAASLNPPEIVDRGIDPAVKSCVGLAAI
jgi:hypothetical protein